MSQARKARDERKEIRTKFLANTFDADSWLSQKDAEDFETMVRSWVDLLMMLEED